MKKVFLLFLALMSVAVCVSAQLGEKTTFGLRAGMGIGGFSSSGAYRLIGGTKSSNWNMENDNKITYNVGAIVDIPVYRKWGLSLQTGLWFTERHTLFKGGNANANHSSTWRNLDLKAMYLQLPVQIGYHYNFNVVNVQALFGPYVEYRVGKGKSHVRYSNGTDNESDAFSDSDDDFSFGLSFGLGAEYRRCFLGAKYDLGLTNYYEGSNKNRKNNNRINLKGNMLSIVVGWNF